MQLRSLEYSEAKGTTNEWILDDFLLGPKTLMVGPNSAGKSRTLSVISALSRHLNGQQAPTKWGAYKCLFLDQRDEYIYELEFSEQKVLREKLVFNGEAVLERFHGGLGVIKFEDIHSSSMMLPFQAPDNMIAAVVRRDTVQHAFLEPLHRWASSLRYYQFGTQLGKDAFILYSPNIQNKVDDRDQNAVVGIFGEGIKEFDEPFKQAIINDMRQVGYRISDIGIAAPTTIEFPGAPGEVNGIYVKEEDLPCVTEQITMSTGMFRVLSLIIHVNFAEMRGSAACVVVDDIGEGLDFNRSCRMIHLLRKKAEQANVQVILSTNDKFVMNEVPLEEWAIIQREGSHVSIKNYSNSKDIFDNFKFTGLSNFAFFELDVINSPEHVEE